MKKPLEIYNIIKNALLDESFFFGISFQAYDNSESYSFKQNNYDISFSYSYVANSWDLNNGSRDYPGDYDYKIYNVSVSDLEICFKDDVIELTEDQYNDLTEIILSIIIKEKELKNL